MALMYHQKLHPPIPFITNLTPSHYHSKPHLFFYSKTTRLFSLFATQSLPTSHSSSPIFLPFLQEEDEEEPEPEPEPEQEQEDDDLKDPLRRFFESRTSTQDPRREGRLSLQKNRRSSWHLATDTDFGDEMVSGSGDEDSLEEENQQLGGENFDLGPLAEEGVVGEILQIARTLPQNLTLGEVLEDFEKGVGVKECVEVLGLMGRESLFMGCLYFFEWMGLQEPSLVTPRACSVLFPLLGRAGMGEKLMILFTNLPKEKEFRDVHVYNAAISGLVASKRYGDAWKVYEAMEAINVCPDHVTCSIMITVMRKIGRSAKEAWDFFERMNRKGVKWSPEVLGALVKSFCDEGLKSEALIIVIEMARKGVFPNAIVYNTLMDAFSKSNRVEEAEGLFAEMKTKGIKPTSATFNILMDAYSRRMQPDVVERLLVEMQDSNLEPNAKSYTCLISAYARQKMSDMAVDAFLRMKKDGISPTSHSYTALIHAYSVTGWHEKAYIAFENMQKERLKPSVETYTALLDAFRRAGDTQTLMRIWKLMMKEKIKGTQVTFNTLVDGFAKQGCYMEARDVISEFGKIGLQPTVMTYNMLINAYARGGQHSKMPQLLKEMDTLDLKPDSISYSTMIYAYIRVRDFKRAFFYHKNMVKSGHVPDAKSYEKLRSILEVKAARKNKKDRSAILGIINSKMGLSKAKKGKKDEFWKNRKKHVRIKNSASSTR
ncbi:Tetratricopeptide-like helical domain containing protein [Parasponia andersonii]|uniref:Tetratricopeptide-like helical domain containing protein n=1 Tax=Parasponia andersonii TaxID=3476 RepID=A0A2P5BA50_PARAD|nr:Tetratricopeptide-like helical domain containing protein [Parasponia andersonii]